MPRPRFNLPQILAWIDAYHRRTGTWPTLKSGHITGGLGVAWRNVDQALRRGYRGLEGGSSLACLLAAERGVRNRMKLPDLTLDQILAWIDAHYNGTATWPTQSSGPVAGAPGETWRGINHALRIGYRGLDGGSSLAQVLAEYRGVPNEKDLPRLTYAQIRAWAKAYRRDTGRWPTVASGPIPGGGGATWRGVDLALRRGGRGLRRKSSLARLLKKEQRR